MFSTDMSGPPFVCERAAKPGCRIVLPMAGQPPARRSCERIELRKIDRSAPWGVPGVAALGCGLVSGMQGSCLWLPLRRRLSPVFYEGAQILFFPAPISCLGERYLPAAHSMSRIIGLLDRTVLQLGLAVQSSGKKDEEEG